MESLRQNKALMVSLLGNSTVILLLACGFLPSLAVQFEIVDFPTQVSGRFVSVTQVFSRHFAIASFKSHSRLNAQPFPHLCCVLQFRMILVQVLIADFVFAFIADRVCLWLFGEGRQHKL